MFSGRAEYIQAGPVTLVVQNFKMTKDGTEFQYTVFICHKRIAIKSHIFHANLIVDFFPFYKNIYYQTTAVKFW